MAEHKNKQERVGSCIAFGVSLGAGIGAALGVAFGNVALGVALGPAVGIALALVYWSARADQDPPNNEE